MTLSSRTYSDSKALGRADTTELLGGGNGVRPFLELKGQPLLWALLSPPHVHTATILSSLVQLSDEAPSKLPMLYMSVSLTCSSESEVNLYTHNTL